jgi:hypothetical protein
VVCRQGGGRGGEKGQWEDVHVCTGEMTVIVIQDLGSQKDEEKLYKTGRELSISTHAADNKVNTNSNMTVHSSHKYSNYLKVCGLGVGKGQDHAVVFGLVWIPQAVIDEL